jgi:hypothetical protein
MSNAAETFLEGLFTDVENAYTKVQPFIAPAVQLGEEILPAVGLIPGAAPFVAGAQAAATALTNVAPTAITDVQALVTEGRQIMTDLGPAGARLSTIFGTLFSKGVVGQTVVLAPTTTAPTVPATTALAPAPGTAKS